MPSKVFSFPRALQFALTEVTYHLRTVQGLASSLVAQLRGREEDDQHHDGVRVCLLDCCPLSAMLRDVHFCLFHVHK